MTDVLQISNLNVYYGQAQILHDVTMAVGSTPTALVGRNGMGKTTLCKAIVGLAASQAGDIRLKGDSIRGAKPHSIARRGIGYVPQGRRIFPSLSVHEHLHIMRGQGAKKPHGSRWSVDRVYELFPRLHERRRVGAGSLSGGEQQMLAIGRALMLNADLLIMDEPSEGLAPVIVDQLVDTIRKLAAEGIALLVVEQKLAVATAIADRLLVMLNGQIALETDTESFVQNIEAQQRYLGVSSNT